MSITLVRLSMVGNKSLLSSKLIVHLCYVCNAYVSDNLSILLRFWAEKCASRAVCKEARSMSSSVVSKFALIPKPPNMRALLACLILRFDLLDSSGSDCYGGYEPHPDCKACVGLVLIIVIRSPIAISLQLISFASSLCETPSH